MALVESGVASDVHDLLDRMRVQLLLQGWTVNLYSTGEPDKHYLYFEKIIDSSLRHFNAQAYLSAEIMYILGSTGFDIQENFIDQPGAGPLANTNLLPAPMKRYSFYAGANYFYVVVEKQSNIFGHFGFGVLEKCGVYEGGEFYFNTYIVKGSSSDYKWDEPDNPQHCYPCDSMSTYSDVGAVRVDTGFGSSIWHANNVNDTFRCRSQSRYQALVYKPLNRSGPNTFNGQVGLYPAYYFVRKAVPDPAWLYAGYPPDLRVLSVHSLDPQEQISLGSDNWDTFPVLQKYGSSTQPNSSNLGIAYRNN